MQRAHRDRSRLNWSLWIIFLGVVAAVACAAHPPSHGHDAAHPPLCTDTSSSTALAPDKRILLPDGGTFPLSPKSLLPLGSLVVFRGLPLVGLLVLCRALPQSDVRTSISPPMFLVVLRQ